MAPAGPMDGGGIAFHTIMQKKAALILVCVFACAALILWLWDEKPDSGFNSNERNMENTLRFDVAAPFTSLNPTESDSSGSTVIFPLLYSYLFVPDVNGKLTPDLADSWTYDHNTFTWTVSLRKDARFHDHSRVKARDAIYSIETILQNIRSALLGGIDKMWVVSDFVLKIRLTRDDPGFMRKIWDFEIIPDVGQTPVDYYNHPMGSGPFAFLRRDKDRQVVLVANPDYYNGRPALKKVVYFYEPDKEKTWTRLLAGATDIAQEISPKNYQIMKQYEKKFYFDHQTLKFYSILLYNTHDPLFIDPGVRTALTCAINRKYIVDTILNGYGKIAAGPMGVDSPFHDPKLVPLPYDPKKAVKLLNLAGWTYDGDGRYLCRDGKCFEFTLFLAKESQVEKKIARYIRLCLNDIGIKIHIRALPMAELYLRYNRNYRFQAVLTESTGAYRRPEYLMDIWTPGPFGVSLAGGFEDPEATRLLDMAMDTTDPAQQKVLFFKADDRIASLQPGTFLFHKTAIDAMSRRFSLPFPFTLSYPGIYRLRLASPAR
ncbi:MAG: ABC transporter substrate-binding protein [Deltaproteobacteria bacterium]|nr:ABC transporter substrate-binding protein [Deltaproteobacteria bacterium]